METMMTDVQGFWSEIEAIPKIARGRVWCTTCGREERVNGGMSMRFGWPKCCGYTMTIDSPEERRAHRGE